MTEYLSKKIKFFSFWLIVGVVILHSVVQNNNTVSSAIQRFISYNLCQVCVPVFFIISGYLFFLNVKEINSIFIKMGKKIKTLLLPYIILTVMLIRTAQKFIFNEYIGLLYYVLIPVISIIICICAAKFLQKYLPKIYKISVGYR